MRILFFMRSGERTGSEIALYNYIEYAVGAGWEVAVASRNEGPLLRQMPAGVSTYLLGRPPEPPGRLRRVYNRVSRRPPEARDELRELHEEFRPDAWYVNTLLEARLVGRAKSDGIPCVLHSHELEQMLIGFRDDEAGLLVEGPDLVVACSQAAAGVLRTLGRGRGVEVCYETINPERIEWDGEKSRAIRRDLGVGDATFVWAMSGTLDPNKNPLRFVEVAREMLAQGLDVHFIWLGAGDSAYGHYARKKAEEAGVADRLSWMGERADDYYDCLNAADGFLLTSSKESFSIVSVEAAHLGKPVVSFDCGGVSEIVREGMGVIVRSWNNHDLIRAMLGAMRGEIGFDPDAARERVREFHIGAQGPRWEKVVREYVTRAAAEG